MCKHGLRGGPCPRIIDLRIMGWLDKLLHKEKEEGPEEKLQETPEATDPVEIDIPEPAPANEDTLETEPQDSTDGEEEPPSQEDPFLLALERHGKDMAGALKEVCRRMDYNDDAEVCLAFISPTCTLAANSAKSPRNQWKIYARK